MSKIADYLNKIKTAIYGREVRDAIHDSIEQCYTDVSNAQTLADTATQNANKAASNADKKAILADNAATAANAAATDANTVTSIANNAASNASAATQNANRAASNADNIATQIQMKLNNGEFVGPTGPKGNTGATPVITASASTGLPGTDVTIKQSGTAENDFLDFTIPRGTPGTIENLDDTLSIEGRAADAKKTGEEISQLKENLAYSNRARLSSYINKDTVQLSNGAYDVTDVIESMFSKGIRTIEIDVDAYSSHSISLISNLEIYGTGGCYLYFKDGSGFKTETSLKNISIHDLNISGVNISDTNADNDNWLIDIANDCSNIRMSNINLEHGYNGMRINGWINQYTNFRISDFRGYGLYLGRSDNTLNMFYINLCTKQGLYMKSSNNRISNFKILSCGKECESMYLLGQRNTIQGIEVQDIFTSCAKLENFNDNIMDANFDAIRTNVKDDSSLTIVEMIESSNNIMRITSSKYGSAVGVTDSSEKDIIKIYHTCKLNSVTAALIRVNIVDEGLCTKLTVLKKDDVPFDMNAIKNLSVKFSEESYSVRYSQATDVTSDYDGYKYCFKNLGGVTYSGPRFLITDRTPRKLFAIAVISIVGTSGTVELGDQLGNADVKTFDGDGGINNEVVLTIVGADDSAAAEWMIVNISDSSEAITLIKYFYIFPMTDYEDVMKEIIPEK